MKKYYLIYIVIITQALIANNHSCIVNDQRVDRQEYLEPETLQSEHFVIHFTTADNDFQNINGELFSLQSNFSFAQSILDLMEIAYSQYDQEGWELPPPDCDANIEDINSQYHCNNFGGNALYDIYLSNDGVGMVVPETPYPVEPYTGGYTSFMKMSTMLNQYNSLPDWAHHVVAHELHHSIQLRYGYSVSGNFGNYMYNGWLFEQTATYMENVIFPNSIHLRTMLANCGVVTPLTYPEYGIDYPAEIYPYRSALWQKFLVESQGDSSIVRTIWEGYGEEYATGNPVSLFPIYDNAIQYVTNNEYTLSDAYKDYAIWRYFTGDRSINNEYFNEGSSYCESTTYVMEDSLEDISISSNGGVSYIQLPLNNINLQFSTSYTDDIKVSYLNENSSNNIYIEDLEIDNENEIFNFDAIDVNSHSLLVYSSYNDVGGNLNFNISLLDYMLGDANFDQVLNVLDVVIIVNFALHIDSPTDLEFEICDLNFDGFINVLDVVQLLNEILG